jgi:cell division protein FtsB
MKRKSINSILLGLAAISVLLFSHGIVSYAQNYSSNATVSSNTSISTSNSTTANNATSQSDNPTVQSIDAAIKALNDDDKDTAKKLLLKAEESLEGKADLVDAEKRVEASLAALKDGDINGAISHAEEAKKNLS